MAGVYVHVPFCLRKCIYCDFFSVPEIGQTTAYVEALRKEMELRRDFLGEEPQTFYIGGGTPSLLPLTLLEGIVEAADRYFDLSHCTEFTLEANPDDLSPEYVRSLRSLPFNRISLGVQSFDDEVLRFLGRRHTARQALRAIDLCRLVGYENLSIDLIYGLPVAEKENSLEAALRLDLPHISAYHLTYEEGTPLYELLQKGLSPIDEEISASQFLYFHQRLSTAGYVHYELSNFAKEGCFSRHNTAYWKGEPYIGLGPSAHSFRGIRREANVRSLPLYLSSLSEGKLPCTVEKLSLTEQFNEYLITRLRTKWGIRMEEVSRLFGERFAESLCQNVKPFIDRGLLVGTEDTFHLTVDGMLLCDAILRSLILLDPIRRG
ncbi:MAG: radical SAM family heme chaperone HemW [Tannerellaceae bacterium]|nr:radical SAM family heme chaperone HemW [Tannerellaceae bacterium]